MSENQENNKVKICGGKIIVDALKNQNLDT